MKSKIFEYVAVSIIGLATVGVVALAIWAAIDITVFANHCHDLGGYVVRGVCLDKSSILETNR